MLDRFLLDSRLREFLAEDLGHGDVTTDAIFTGNDRASARLVAREELVCVGMQTVAARVFSLLDAGIDVARATRDGEVAKKGDVLLEARGPVRALLRGERVALNLVQRLCGIATLTAAYVAKVADLNVKIVDTRKTTPGLRMLEKYAVRAGGGSNHRYNLSDGILVKDNHIAACGSITETVKRLRATSHHLLKLEVECDTLSQVQECLDCGVEVIMLDNMDLEDLREAVRLVAGRSLLEASGGVDLNTVRAIAETGVDIISVGALTHSAPSVDIGMDWLA